MKIKIFKKVLDADKQLQKITSEQKFKPRLKIEYAKGKEHARSL